MNGEKSRLEEVAKWYQSLEGFYSRLVAYGFVTFMKHFKGNTVLELGCADGLMTEMLIKHFDKVVVVDGASKFCREVKSKLENNNLIVICSLFEELNLSIKFDTIIMAHTLEHVDKPVQIISSAKDWLNDNGVILISVPNANSLHRLAGVKMGLLTKCEELNDLDKRLGHRRVYTQEALRNDIELAGLKIKEMGGVFLKPLTNSQIEEWWTEEMMDAFYELGKDFPEIAGEIYAICQISLP